MRLGRKPCGLERVRDRAHWLWRGLAEALAMFPAKIIPCLIVRATVRRASLLGLLFGLVGSSVRANVPASAPLSREMVEILTQFYAYDKALPLDVRIAEKSAIAGNPRDKFVFTSQAGDRVPGLLVFPKQATGPVPCVVLLHGMGGSKDAWWRADNFSRNLAPRLVESGFAVMMLDAPFSGERTQMGDFDNPNTFMTPQRTLPVRLRDMILRAAVDYRRALNYLETRPEIDAKRIGAVGYSMGGVAINNLMAVEPRFKAAVACVAPPFSRQARMAAGPAMAGMDAVAPGNFAPLLGDRPILYLMGTTDVYYTKEEAEEMVSTIPGTAKQLKFFESGHQLPPEYIDDAIAWMRTHLQ
jgi:dienelactone hydrolase